MVKDESGQFTLAADVLYHDPDKRTLAYMDKPLLQDYKGKVKALIFNRVNTKPRCTSFLVGGRAI
ncbi:MAG: hypothetical protein LBS94_02920, partial [Prevotellaceae bacterium]|nr:hypothetical protein [Prevotellaceae bacterium]